MAIQIQFRRGTAAAWTSANPLLASGEPGLETDTLKWKVGNGTQNWTALPYTLGSVPATAYGTTLPGSPADGQEAILVDSTTNPTYQWRFRYNAGSSSTYKWEYVGGSAASNFIGTTESSSAASWVDLTTVGPQFTVPHAGDYLIQIDCAVQGASGWVHVGATVGGSTGQPEATAYNASGQFSSLAASRRVTGIAASTLVKMQYHSNGVAGVGYLFRSLNITPVRVS